MSHSTNTTTPPLPPHTAVASTSTTSSSLSSGNNHGSSSPRLVPNNDAQQPSITRKKSKTFASLFKNGRKKKLNKEREKHQALVEQWLTGNPLPNTNSNSNGSNQQHHSTNGTGSNNSNLSTTRIQKSLSFGEPQRRMETLDNKLEQTGLMFAHYETARDTIKELIDKNKEMSQMEMALSKSLNSYMRGVQLPTSAVNIVSEEPSSPTTFSQPESLKKCGVHISEALSRLSMTRANLGERLAVDVVGQLKVLEEDNEIVEAKAKHRLNAEIDYQLAKRDHDYYSVLNTMMSHYISYFETALTTLKNVQNKMNDLPRVNELPKIQRGLFDYGNEIQIFGVHIDVILQRWDEPGPVPVVIEEMLSYLEKNCLNNEGLMRISGHTAEMERLRTMIDEGKRVDYYRAEISSKPHTVCGLIKMFTRELPEPLLTFDLFDQWINAVTLATPEEQLAEIKRLLAQVPLNNRNCLARLIQFFSRIASSPATKMTATTIAISFGMNLMRMRPELEDHIKLAQSTKHINKICELLIVHCQELFVGAVKLNQYRGTIFLKELGLTKVLERLSDMHIVEEDEETDSSDEHVTEDVQNSSPVEPIAEETKETTQEEENTNVSPRSSTDVVDSQS